MEFENSKESKESRLYMEKLLKNGGPIPFFHFNGRCFGEPNKEVPLPPISKEDMARFQEVPITDGKFNDWCKPWKNSFMITMLGKRVRFHQLEAKLNCSWTRKGFIKIIDVPREYYQFLFTSNEDYNHALMEGHWMVVDHYILVQR